MAILGGRSGGGSSRELGLTFTLRGDSSKMPADFARAKGLISQFTAQTERDDVASARRISSERVRVLRRSHAEQLREHDRAARGAASVYERHLGSGFFSRLARSATDAFKRNFSVSGLLGGGGGGGGLLSSVAGVAGGNILTSVLGGITSQITGAVQAGFDFNKLKEQSLLAFEIKLKGKKEAEDFFNQVAQFAEDTPLELDQALTSVQKLMVAFTAPEALRSMRAITDEVAKQGKVGGEAQEAINGVGLQLQQMLLKGKVQQEELVSLAERQVDVYKYLVDELARQDKNFAKLDAEQQKQRLADLVQKGMIDARAAVATIVKGMEADAGGTAARIARETAEGMESNIKDSLNRTAGIASESAFKEYKKFLGLTLDFLNTGAAERIAGSISATTGGIFAGLEKTLSAIQSGNLGQLGLDAVNSAAAGVKSGAQGLYDAGAGAAGRLEQGWRDRMVQHSPSQVMLNLGFEAGQSLLTGFLKGAQSSETMDRIERAIQEAAERFKIDPELIRAVIKKESSFRPGAVSPVGAEGLMQLMPGTAARYGVRNPFNIEQNVMGGTAYLADLLREFKDLRLAIAAYNAGEGAVRAYLPNRPDVNSYVGGSGRRWSVSEDVAQRAQGIPNNGQTPEYVDTVMRYYRQFTGGSASSGGAIPVVITNLRPFEETVRGFPGRPVDADAERRAQGSNEPRPNPGDLTGGVGRFVGDNGNQQGFLLWLYDLNKSFAERGSTTVAAQADYEHKVALMADELNVTTNFVRMAQEFVAQRLELERRAALSAQGAVNGGSLNPLTYDEVKRRITEASANRPIPQESGIIATQIAAQPLASVKLVAKEAGDSFTNLPPLVKKSGKEMEKEMAEVARNVSGIVGGFLQSTLRGQWREGLRGMKDDFLSWGVSLAEDWLKSRIFKLLSPKGGGATGGGGGGLLGSLFGGIKSLFGFGGSAAAGAVGGAASAASVASPAAISAILGGVAPGAGVASVFGGGTAAALFGGGGGAALGLGLGGSSGAAAAGGTAAGSGGLFGSMGALLTNPWTAVAAGGIIAGIALWKHFGHRTEKELRKAIRQMRGVDIKDMSVLQQIKAVGEAAFGRGQVRAHLAETINLAPVQEIIDNYAASTGQEGQKQQLPHDFLYNSVGGPSSSPISVSGNTPMPSPFSSGAQSVAGGAQATQSAQGLGPMGSVFAPVLDYIKSAREEDRMRTALIAQSMREVSGALRPFTTASPTDIVQMAADTINGQRAIGVAAHRHMGESPSWREGIGRIAEGYGWQGPDP